MRAALLALLLGTVPASADQLSTEGCAIIGASADRYSDRLADIRTNLLGGTKFHEAIASMPPDAKTAAIAVEDVQDDLIAALDAYEKAMRDFASKINDCR